MNWKERYRAALIEIDPTRLLNLIQDTEAAMSLRSESLPAVTTQELLEMSDAAYTLRVLKSRAEVGSLARNRRGL